MSTVAAYAAPDAGAPLQRTTIERRSVGEHDVLVEVKYVGICHSDIHQARGDWGQKLFPMVPGHEIAGLVTEVGESKTVASACDVRVVAPSPSPGRDRANNGLGAPHRDVPWWNMGIRRPG